MRNNRMFTYIVGLAALAAVLSLAGVRLAVLFPLALVVACPLMMMFMMRGTGDKQGEASEDHTGHGCEHDPTSHRSGSASR